jgi:WD40 repeat protein
MAAAAAVTIETAPAPAGFRAIRFDEGDGRVYALLPLADDHIVTGDEGGTLAYRNLATGKTLWHCAGHSRTVYDFTTLPDGNIASASADRHVKVWDLATGSCLNTLEGHTRSIFGITTLPDGRLASSSYDKTVKLWDPRSTTCTQTLTYSEPAQDVLVLADGRLASSCYDGTVKLWDLRATDTSAQKLAAPLRGYVGPLAQLPNGRLAAGGDGYILVWDLASGELKTKWRAHSGIVLSLVARPSGRLTSAGKDVTLTTWDPDTQTPVTVEKHIGVHSLAVTAKDELLCGMSGFHTLNNIVGVFS